MRWWKWFWIALGVVFLGALTWAIFYFGYFGKQLPVRDFGAEHGKLVRAMSGINSSVADAWPRLKRVIVLTDEAYEAVYAAPLPRSEDGLPDLTRVVDFARMERASPPTQEMDETSERLRVAMEERGVWKALDELSREAGYVVPPGEGLILTAARRDLNMLRMYARASLWYSRRDLEKGDELSFVNAYERCVGLSRLASTQADMISILTGRAILGKTITDGNDAAMLGRLSAPSLTRMRKALENWKCSPTDAVIDGEFLTSSTMLWASMGDSWITPLSRSAQINRLDLYCAQWREYARHSARERATLPAPEFPSHDMRYAPADIMMPVFSRLLMSIDRGDSERGGALILLAIEAFRKRTGKLPESLAQLVPGELTRLPDDPFHDGGYIYQRLQPVASDGPGYMLYSVGADREDNGGVREDSKAPPQDRDRKKSDLVFTMIGP